MRNEVGERLLLEFVRELAGALDGHAGLVDCRSLIKIIPG